MAGLEGIAQLMEADDFRRRLDMYERQNEARRNFETSLKPKLLANIKSKELSKAKKKKTLKNALKNLKSNKNRNQSYDLFTFAQGMGIKHKTCRKKKKKCNGKSKKCKYGRRTGSKRRRII